MRALPQLEHHERPEAVAVVGAARRMLVEQPFDGRGAEPAARARRLAEQEVARERAQLAAEPRGERNAEAALAAAGDARREIVCERAAQRDLAFAAAPLQVVGQREAELDDAMVEQRRAQLERVRHRRDVRLRQEVAGQVGLDVEALEPCDAVRHAAAQQEARREKRADLGPRVVRPELRGARSSVSTSISRP